MRFVSAVLALFVMLATSVHAVAAGKVALVIGNGAYVNANPLPNPPNDANDMAALLQRMGFTVISGIDLDRAAMGEKIGQFDEAAQDADVTLFFYAGHGLQVNGKNYLVPVNAKLDRESSLQFEAIEVDSVLNTMTGPEKAAIAILDACRDNPLSRSLARSMAKTRSGTVAQGLAAPKVGGGGILIGFATSPDDVAADGDGRNSPFTAALLKHLVVPGVEIQQVMTRVKRDVYAATKQDQEPWHNTSLRDEIFLGGDAPQNPPPPVVDTAAAEWEAVKDSDSAAVLSAFAEKHAGNAVFAALAKARIEALREKDLALLDSLKIKKDPPPKESGTDIFDSLTIKKNPPPEEKPDDKPADKKDEILESLKIPEKVIKRSEGRSWTMAQFFDYAKAANAGKTTYALLGTPQVELPKPGTAPGKKTPALNLVEQQTAASLNALIAENNKSALEEARVTNCRLDFMDRCPFLTPDMIDALTRFASENGVDVNNHDGNYFNLTPLDGERFILSNAPAFGTGEVAIIAALLGNDMTVQTLLAFDMGRDTLGTEGGNDTALVNITGAAIAEQSLLLSFDTDTRCAEKPRKLGFVAAVEMDSWRPLWVSPWNVTGANLIYDAQDKKILAANGGSCSGDFLYEIDATTGAVDARAKLPSAVKRMDWTESGLVLELFDRAGVYALP